MRVKYHGADSCLIQYVPCDQQVMVIKWESIPHGNKQQKSMTQKAKPGAKSAHVTWFQSFSHVNNVLCRVNPSDSAVRN